MKVNKTIILLTRLFTVAILFPHQNVHLKMLTTSYLIRENSIADFQDNSNNFYKIP